MSPNTSNALTPVVFQFLLLELKLQARLFLFSLIYLIVVAEFALLIIIEGSLSIL